MNKLKSLFSKFREILKIFLRVNFLGYSIVLGIVILNYIYNLIVFNLLNFYSISLLVFLLAYFYLCIKIKLEINRETIHE